jgi:hypothetical protein
MMLARKFDPEGVRLSDCRDELVTDARVSRGRGVPPSADSGRSRQAWLSRVPLRSRHVARVPNCSDSLTKEAPKRARETEQSTLSADEA